MAPPAPPAVPATPVACPRCATPLATLAPGAVVSQVALQCPRCGTWIRLGEPPAAGRRTGWALGLELGALILALLGALALAALGASLSSLATATRQAGAPLPGLTAFALAWHLPWLLAGLVVACAGAWLVLRRRGHPAARWALGAAVALPVLGAPVCVVAMYLPLFSLADIH